VPHDENLTAERPSFVTHLECSGTGERYPLFTLDPAPLPFDRETTAPMGCLPGDFNEDGLTDVGAVGFDGSVYWWAGNGDATFAAQQSLLSGTPLSGYAEARSGDFNNDGRTDVVALDAGKKLWWWAGNGSGGLLAAQQLASGVSDVFVNGIQVLKDGDHTGATPGKAVFGAGYKEPNP